MEHHLYSIWDRSSPGDLRGHQPTWLLKDPIHSFSSDFQENKTKPKRTIPKLCFLVNPYGCSHPFEQNCLSWCYLETTGKGGRVASRDRSPSPWVPSWLLGGLWWGCWWRCFSGALVWGDSSIDVIEKTPKFTTKSYRLDTVLLRRELSLYTVVLPARIQGPWVVKSRVSPSGLLHGVAASAACCGGGSWDQAQQSAFACCVVWWLPQKLKDTGWSKTIVQGKPWS